MSIVNTETGEKLFYKKNTSDIINIYMNQSKSIWNEIPSNQIKDTFVSPFHYKVSTHDLLKILNIAEKYINYIFKISNSSAIILQQSKTSQKNYRIIYPELLLTYQNEKRLIETLKQFIPIDYDTDTQLPYSGKYKCIGLHDQQVIIEEDYKPLANLNGILFDQALGQINYIVKRRETEFNNGVC